MKRNNISQRIVDVTTTLDKLIKILNNIGTEVDIERAKSWKYILLNDPSAKEINDVWAEIQHIGGHMGYMDYSNPDYIKVKEKLLNHMLELIVSIRKI